MNGITTTFKGANLRHVWTYHGPTGEEVGKVARYDHPDGRKDVVPYKLSGNGWKMGLIEGKHPLYNLPAITRATPDQGLYIVEGEKCATALVSLGFTVTTWQGGSNSIDRTDWEPLNGRKRVLILPDNDEPGTKAARAVVGKLEALDEPPQMLLIKLPGLPEKGDVVDWIKARYSDWDEFKPIPEEHRQWLKTELEQATQDHIKPVPDEWASGSEWPELRELAPFLSAEPYPIDALPRSIRAAVEEVQSYAMAPLPMVATCALSALSLAIQPHINVKRAGMLISPVSLYTLTIAESGERKTTTDKLFTQSMRDYDRKQEEIFKPEVDKYMADMQTWEAEKRGVSNRITQLASKEEPCDKEQLSFQKLQANMPEEPRIPKLILGDETPENLAWRLAKKWPSSGVLSSEAGTVFGSHGMKSDSAMKNLSLLNILWEDGELPIGRKTSESFTVRGVRLTMALQVQASVLRDFFDKSGDLARGSGFLARFLVTQPESTQGTRMFREPPESWPELKIFNGKIWDILEAKVPYNHQKNILEPALVSFTPKAKEAWVSFYNAIESELGEGGELRDIQDVASKIADNAARLAALFQYFEKGKSEIEADMFNSAAGITAWHLNEARRFFGELALPPAIESASKLESWLVKYCTARGIQKVNSTIVGQYATPGYLRAKTAWNIALNELQEAGRARLVKEGRSTFIELCPALLGVETGVAA